MNSRSVASKSLSCRVLVFALALLLVSGCTTMERVEYSPEELRDAVRAGEVVQPGDRVAVTTVSGGELVLVVTEVDDEVIGGTEEEVPIDALVAPEKRETQCFEMEFSLRDS